MARPCWNRTIEKCNGRKLFPVWHFFAAVFLMFPFVVRSQTCTNAPPGLVGWYRAEGNANDSAGTGNGTFFNPAYVTGEVGQAFSFNGTSSFIQIVGDSALNFTSNAPMSIELWANRIGSATTMHLLGKRGSACGAIQYQISLTPGAGLAFTAGNGSVATGFQMPTNVWMHLAVTFDGTNFLFYTNGVLAASGTGDLGAPNGAPVYLGTSSSCPGFAGLIDEASFYNRALSVSEIQAVYNAGSVGKCLIPPAITAQPQSQTVPVGTNVTFTVIAVGAAPLSYQWRFGGTNLTGATGTSLTLTNVQSTNVGNYSVVITNAGGSVTSSNALLSIVGCTSTPLGLISWWAAEGNANDRFGTNDGTLVNGAGFAPGEVGQAFSVNGNGQYINILRSPGLDVSNQVTIDFWMNSDPSNPIGSAIEGLVTSDFYGIEMNSTPGHVGLNLFLSTNSGGFWPGTSDLNGIGMTFPAGEWHHVAGTYDGTNMQMYLDGRAFGNPRPWSGTISPMFVNSTVTIGSEDGRTSCGCGGRYFHGLIDEVDIFNRALSSNEIAAIYNAGSFGKCLPPPYFVVQPQSQTVFAGANVTFTATAVGASPLKYQWQLGGTNITGATQTTLAVTNVLSTSGGYSVTVSNSLGTITSSNAFLTVIPPGCTPNPAGIIGWWRGESNAVDTAGTNSGTLQGGVSFTAGEVGHAFSFDGSGFVQIPTAPSLNFTGTSPMTVELWAYTTVTQTSFSFLGKRDTGCGLTWEYQMAYDPNNGLHFNSDSGGPTYSGGVFTHLPFPLNTWMHLTATFDGSTFLFYTNGVVAATGTGTLGPLNNAPLMLGSSGGCGVPFVGLLDEVTLYNRALSSSEIQSIYLSGSFGKCGQPPLIAVQPQNQAALVGQSVSLAVLVDGSTPLAYQWSLNGTNLAGATASSLLFTNVQLANAGVYSATISNAFGFITSSNASLSVNVPVCDSVVSNLISWWAGEGNANDNMGTNSGLPQGGVGFTAGAVGEAFNFDGLSGNVIVPDSPSLRITNQLTIEAWINTRSTNSDRDIVSKMGGVGGNNGYEFFLSRNSLQGFFNSPGQGWPSATISCPIPITLGAWNHVAFTYDHSAMKLYFNGQPIATNAIGPATINFATSNLRIGGNENNQNYFDGQIDEAAVYNRALNSAEIQAIYNAASAGRCMMGPSIQAQPQSHTVPAGADASFSVSVAGSNPFAYQWQLNGTNLPGATASLLALTNVQLTAGGIYSVFITNTGGFATSSNAFLVVTNPVCVSPSNLVAWWSGEGNANDNLGTNSGTLFNNVTFGAGKVGRAFGFDGVSSFVQVPNAPSLNFAPTSSITVELWAYRTGALTTLNILGKRSAGCGATWNYHMAMDTNNGVHFSGGPSVGAFTHVLLPTNDWIHLAGTFDGATFRFYTNGVLLATGSGTLGPTNTQPLTIGTSSSCQPFSGLLDEVAIYNRALPAAEIQGIYAAQALSKCPLPPAFVAQPQSKTVKPGTNVTFTAAATGSNPLGYQWQLNGGDLAGATNSSLVLTNVQPSDAGTYAVRASNILASVTSSNALLKVQVITVLGNGQILSNAQYTFGNQVMIQLQNFFTNGDVFYTLDGSTPSFASTPYAGPFILNQAATLQALGYDANFIQSGLSDPISVTIVPTYTLTTITAGGGTISLNPTNSPYLSNSVVGLMATPSNGWSFLQWAGDVSGTNLTNSVLMNGNRSVQALFGTSLGTASSAGGSVLRSPSAALYPFGMSVQLSALPQTNNYFALWGNAASGNFNPLYFVLTNANPTVSALFVALGSNQVSLAVIPVGHGRVSVVPQANVFTNGQAVTITATPETNQVFLGWSGDASGTQNPLTISMGPSKTIYANFSKIYNFGFTPLTGLGLKAGFQLNLTGEIPVAYRFDASTNLTNWLPLITLTNYTGTLQYKDTNATNFNLRFYRGVPLP